MAAARQDSGREDLDKALHVREIAQNLRRLAAELAEVHPTFQDKDRPDVDSTHASMAAINAKIHLKRDKSRHIADLGDIDEHPDFPAIDETPDGSKRNSKRVSVQKEDSRRPSKEGRRVSKQNGRRASQERAHMLLNCAPKLFAAQERKGVALDTEAVEANDGSDSGGESNSMSENSTMASDISEQDFDSFDVNKWHTDVMEMIDKLQTKDEWEMMSALRKQFRQGDNERTMEMDRIQALDIKRGVEGDRFGRSQLSLEKDVEAAQMKMISALSGFTGKLGDASDSVLQARRRQRMANKKFSFSGMKAYKRPVKFSSEHDDNDSSQPRATARSATESKASELLRVISTQQGQIASLQVDKTMLEKKLGVHKITRAHVENVKEGGGVSGHEPSEEVKEIIFSYLAKISSGEKAAAGGDKRLAKMMDNSGDDLSPRRNANSTTPKVPNDAAELAELQEEVDVFKKKANWLVDAMASLDKPTNSMKPRASLGKASRAVLAGSILGAEGRRGSAERRRRSSTEGAASAIGEASDAPKLGKGNENPDDNGAVKAVLERVTQLQKQLPLSQVIVKELESDRDAFYESVSKANELAATLNELGRSRASCEVGPEGMDSAAFASNTSAGDLGGSHVGMTPSDTLGNAQRMKKEADVQRSKKEILDACGGHMPESVAHGAVVLAASKEELAKLQQTLRQLQSKDKKARAQALAGRSDDLKLMAEKHKADQRAEKSTRRSSATMAPAASRAAAVDQPDDKRTSVDNTRDVVPAVPTTVPDEKATAVVANGVPEIVANGAAGRGVEEQSQDSTCDVAPAAHTTVPNEKGTAVVAKKAAEIVTNGLAGRGVEEEIQEVQVAPNEAATNDASESREFEGKGTVVPVSSTGTLVHQPARSALSTGKSKKRSKVQTIDGTDDSRKPPESGAENDFVYADVPERKATVAFDSAGFETISVGSDDDDSKEGSKEGEQDDELEEPPVSSTGVLRREAIVRFVNPEDGVQPEEEAAEAEMPALAEAPIKGPPELVARLMDAHSESLELGDQITQYEKMAKMLRQQDGPMALEDLEWIKDTLNPKSAKEKKRGFRKMGGQADLATDPEHDLEDLQTEVNGTKKKTRTFQRTLKKLRSHWQEMDALMHILKKKHGTGAGAAEATPQTKWQGAVGDLMKQRMVTTAFKTTDVAAAGKSSGGLELLQVGSVHEQPHHAEEHGRDRRKSVANLTRGGPTDLMVLKAAAAFIGERRSHGSHKPDVQSLEELVGQSRRQSQAKKKTILPSNESLGLQNLSLAGSSVDPHLTYKRVGASLSNKRGLGGQAQQPWNPNDEDEPLGIGLSGHKIGASSDHQQPQRNASLHHQQLQRELEPLIMGSSRSDGHLLGKVHHDHVHFGEVSEPELHSPAGKRQAGRASMKRRKTFRAFHSNWKRNTTASTSVTGLDPSSMVRQYTDLVEHQKKFDSH